MWVGGHTDGTTTWQHRRCPAEERVTLGAEMQRGPPAPLALPAPLLTPGNGPPGKQLSKYQFVIVAGDTKAHLSE